MSKQGKKSAKQRESEAAFPHQWENTYDILDIFKDIIAFVLTTGFAFGWMFLMLLIISFFTLSYIHFDIKEMFVVSLITGAAAGIAYIIKTVKKYRGMTRKNK